MALKYTIIHNESTWNSTTDVDSIALSNGSVTSSITSAGTRTLNTAGKVAANNIVIGAKTLNCAGKIMAGNVVITAENSGPIYVPRPVQISNIVQYDALEEAISGYDSSKMTYSGTRYPSYSGRFNIIIKLKDKTTYCWEDGTTEDIPFSYRVY